MYYKYENEELLSGPCLTFPDGVYIDEASAPDLEYPYQGWYWFPNEEEAKLFFGIE
jgi:hypothetical protein